VDWYSDCGNGLPSQPFEVRVIAPGYTNTFSKSVAPGDTTQVTTFEVGGGFGITAPSGSKSQTTADPYRPHNGPKPDINELKAALRNR